MSFPPIFYGPRHSQAKKCYSSYWNVLGKGKCVFEYQQPLFQWLRHGNILSSYLKKQIPVKQDKITTEINTCPLMGHIPFE